MAGLTAVSIRLSAPVSFSMVTAESDGPTLEHHSSPVEGHMNRIKIVKRQLHGHPNLDLFRNRVQREC